MNAFATAAAAALHHAAPRQARARREAAPALPPLNRLDRTHHDMLDRLAALVQLVTQLEAQGLDETTRQSAKALCKFFSETARRHHADEETLVFPALIRQGDPALVALVLRLQQDHGWLEEDWLEFSPQLQAVAEGHSGYEPETLRQAVAVFSGLYQEHIALEESLIYPEARRQLAAESGTPVR